MQIFYLPEEWTIILCIILWPIFQVSAALLCLKIPDRCFSPDTFLFKERRWESKGQLYEKVFKIRAWKRFLPDGGAVVKSGYRKRHLTDHSKENLEKFLIETCRAELSHAIAILPFWVFGLFAPPMVILYMLLYAVAINLPCILTQRYNRMRFVRVLNKLC